MRKTEQRKITDFSVCIVETPFVLTGVLVEVEMTHADVIGIIVWNKGIPILGKR
ncbi:MAG: hypothetical protein SOX17_04415 [Prevotella sp.]|nr:hypothetical protein [Prevotella sp.]MDD7605570.1 hypothetical protein [Prevotellaceae bacterium]MDY3247725.1 hypothetical protein [Prevotella sp.]